MDKLSSSTWKREQGRQDSPRGNAFLDAQSAASLLSLLMLLHCPNKLVSSRPSLDPFLSRESRAAIAASVAADHLPVADDVLIVSVDLHLISNSCSPLNFLGCWFVNLEPLLSLHCHFFGFQWRFLPFSLVQKHLYQHFVLLFRFLFVELMCFPQMFEFPALYAPPLFLSHAALPMLLILDS